MKLFNYARGEWVAGTGEGAPIRSAVTGRVIAAATTDGLDFAGMLDFAREKAGPVLRRLTFHQRAVLLKQLGQYLTSRKEELYAISFDTGATRADSWIDIEGGIGTMLVFASKGRRELPDETFAVDGAVEQISRGGSFIGQHILTPLHGVAVHVNAFNFPCWGLLEKFAPAFLAGVPVIAKPATATAYVAEALVRMIVESGILPAGSLQLIAGPTGDLLDHLTGQDVVSFTGSAATSQMLQRHETIARNAVRFIAERDSLNASVLGPDAVPGTPEFDLFVKEVAREMTVKAGQKCTAIRRAIVPNALVEPVGEALAKRLAATRIGNPALETTRMGALASLAQRRDVLEQVERLKAEAELICGDQKDFAVDGADREAGAFVEPVLLRVLDARAAKLVHGVEAFGPVSTLIGYDDLGEAIELVKRGEGSLVASVVSHDPETVRELVFGIAAHHGRVLVLDRDCAKESTGHGSPLAHLVHGGPGRAGGGEEMGGIRGVAHYMQRTALQGSPAVLSSLTRRYVRGAPIETEGEHPFRVPFEDLEIGRSFVSGERVVTLDDIEHFAHFTGDTFYAHMDAEAVKDHPFFPGRVAHGYLLLAFAAGLFVEPNRGPVLANTGLDNLRFVKPVEPGEAIGVRLTVKQKTRRNDQYGEVRWDVEVKNRAGEPVANYELLTMNAYRAAPAQVA